MENWFDAQAKKAAGADMSRRTMLKRAGVISAGVWAAPVLQSVTAPAYATTGVQTPVCSNVGQTCGASGCPDGKCAQAKVCSTNADCQSGYVCSPAGFAPDGARYCVAGNSGPAGHTCVGGTDIRKYCYTNRTSCNGSTCRPSTSGGYCRTADDCTGNAAAGGGTSVCVGGSPTTLGVCS